MIRCNLSIFNFNVDGKWEKKFREIFLVMGIVAFFLSGCMILNYLYWQEDIWSRILWHNFYKQTENIDYVYLGSSHVFFDLNPEILDKKNGKNNFNLSTGSQRIIESYYLLKEADRCNKIEKVYVEMYYFQSTGVYGNYREEKTIQNGWRNLDYMKFSFGKLDMLFHMNPMQYYIDAIFPFVRYREHLMDGDWIKDGVDYKRTVNYKEYSFKDGTGEFRDKGYYYIIKELEDPLFLRNRMPEEMYLTEDAEIYLRKTIEYCKKREIPIILFSSPIYEIQLMSTENYDSYANRIKEIADEYQIPYYDFNMVKEEYLPIQYSKYFKDVGHLNAKGAELYTDFFHQVVSSSQEDNKRYFYDSYQEKMSNVDPKVYGLYYYIVDDEEIQEGELGNTRRMVIGATRGGKLEYQIFLEPDTGESVLVQDFSENNMFNISTEEHGICKIAWREKGNTGKDGEIKIQY